MLKLRSATVLALCFALSFVCLTTPGWGQWAAVARVPAVPSGAVDLGVTPAATPVMVRLYLTPDAARMAELDQLLVEQQTVGSASYHQWLTPVAFGARFGAADSVAAVKAFAESEGLSVDVAASGLRVTLSGTASQVEQAFAPGLHAYAVGGTQVVANTAVPVVPRALAASVLAVSGLDGLTAKSSVLGAAVAATDLPGQMDDVVSANAARVVALQSTACVDDLSAAARTAFEIEAKQAAAQGMTVLATAGCVGGTSFPAVLPEVTAVAMAPGVAGEVALPSESRPAWQWAPGLPADGLRYAPDVTVTDVAALMQTLAGIAAKMPAGSDGQAARLGSVSATLYRMAPIAGVFAQPDGAAAGTWEPGTGLGVLNLRALDQYFPRGSQTVFVGGTASNYAPTHGQSTTLMSKVSDISGSNSGNVPTGTITFTLADGTVLGTGTMASGSASLTLNTLPGGSVEFIPSYSGDANFAPGVGYGTYLSVQGEPVILSSTISGTTPLGGTIAVVVTATSGSGVGTPLGTATAAPQGLSDMNVYSAPLTGSGGTSTATIHVPASQAGGLTLLVNCSSTDLSFTCYSPQRSTAVVKQATSGLSFTVSPNPPVTGTTTTFVGTVTGVASPAPAPTGSVSFYDNGGLLGTATLLGGTATYTTTSLTSSAQGGVQAHAGITHAFTASYSGDVNYQASSAAAPRAVTLTPTTTVVTVSPNPPATGTTTTVTATVAYTSSGTAATGTVTFLEDGTAIGTGTLNAAGVATMTSTTIDGLAAHNFVATYAGDGNYATSTSPAFSTQVNTATVTTTTTVAASGATANAGAAVTFTATVTPASTVGGVGPTGTVTFSSSTQGVLGSATVTGTTAVLSVPFITAGAQAITATYNGDATYKASVSAIPAAVTVTAVVAPISLVVVPATNAMYSTPVTATVNVSGISTTTAGAAPAGTVLFSVAAAGTTTGLPTTATVAITPLSLTTGTATYTFTAPTPGLYTVTATCTGTDFSCTAIPATQSLVTVKGNTVTTVTALPTAITLGQPTTLTATITPASPLSSASVFTGTVTFYNTGGVALGTATVSGNTASLVTTFASTTGNTVSAVYAGDTNWNGSTSSPLPLAAFVIPTTSTLSANYVSALQGSNVIFRVTVSDAPSVAIPSPGVPTGVVTFYDVFNGQSVPLGTATLVQSGPYSAVAQVSTSGLFHGVHVVTAFYAGNTTYGASTSFPVQVTIADYSVTFNPAQLSLPRGASGTATVTIAPLNGFSGTVTLGCTPPADTLTTCTFNPTSLTGGGVATLLITTTAAHSVGSQSAGTGGVGLLGTALAAGLGCLLFPRRRRPALLAFIALCGLLAAGGCGLGTTSTGVGSGSSGSPLGTQSFSIVTSGSDGVTTNRHDSQFQVTIQ